MNVKQKCQGHISGTVYFWKGNSEENNIFDHDIRFAGQNLKQVLHQKDASLLTTKTEKWHQILRDVRTPETAVLLPT